MVLEEIKIRIAGSGGQGIVSAGIILANSFFLKKFQVFQTQTYGAAVRGSSAACDVIISSREIYEVNMDRVNYLLVMNKSSFNAYRLNLIEGGAILILNSLLNNSQVDIKNRHLQVYLLNDEKILKEIKSPLPLSMSLIGGFLKITDLISLDIVEDAIKKNLSQKYHEINVKALKLGFQNIKKI